MRAAPRFVWQGRRRWERSCVLHPRPPVPPFPLFEGGPDVEDCEARSKHVEAGGGEGITRKLKEMGEEGKDTACEAGPLLARWFGQLRGV